MDSSIYDQLFESDSGNFAADRIESGNYDSFRRVVDNKIYACHCLERADISTLTTDNSPLHLITGKLHDGNRCLRDVICSASLDRADHKFLSFLVCLFLCLRLDLFDHDGGIMSYIVFNNF